MKYQVEISAGAASDLIELYQYIYLQDSPARAAYVIERLESACASLYSNPSRGSHPAEMILLDNRKYREIFFKPYRIVYRVAKNMVYVVMIVDGRRDMPTLFQERLLLGRPS